MHPPAEAASFDLNERQSRRGLLFGSASILALTLYLLFLPLCLRAAPFAEYFQFTQPDGAQLVLWGEGDEFHAVFETTSGYTVVFEPTQQAYFYAQRASDGKSLISSGVPANDPVPPGLAQHIRIDYDAVVTAARVRQKQWDAETGLSKRWSQLKSRTLRTPLPQEDMGALPAPPGTTTIGTKAGLTLLIDFPDVPATISQTEIDAFLNGDSYTGFGNNGSVKEYFSDVSGSRLTYTNVVTIYIRMAQPKTYYNDTNQDCGVQGRLLINDALAILKARSDYSNTILPTFSSLTTGTSGDVLAFNVLFAGTNSGVWGYGLWPHSWVLGSSVPLGNGKSVSAYQITNIGTLPRLGTFCHENGHMLCGFPDLYDYDYDSIGGAGDFSLMGSGGSGTNPVQVDAYLKLAAGWSTVTDLDSLSDLTGTLLAAPNSGYDHFYRYRRPGVTTEYFLLENRQQTGRDADVPAAGIAVWHIDELGDRDNQSMEPNTSHLNYEVTLVQADNLWHFENDVNSGDESDLFYQGNSAPAYTNRLSDSSTPDAHWWNGTTSGMNLSGFSIAGPSMTFQIGSGGSGLPAPVLSAEPPITPGTENSVYWSAVSSPAGIPLAGSRHVHQHGSETLVSTRPIAPRDVRVAVTTTEMLPGTAAPSSIVKPIQPAGADVASVQQTLVGPRDPSPSSQRPLQRRPETTASVEVRGDGSEPVQATLPVESVFVPQFQGEKVISDSGLLAPTTVFGETFEGSFPGTSWTLYGSPTWNDVDYDKHGGSRSGWCAGSSLSPATGYTDNMDAWMVYGPFSLVDATGASMSFWYKNLSESGSDYFLWLASVDGVNFAGYQISGDQNNWVSQVFDLTNVPTLGDLRGRPQVWVAFAFESNSAVSGPTYKGAYVDDVVVAKDAPAPDLTPYQCPYWNDKIPIGISQLAWDASHNYTGPYYDNQTLYFNWGSLNQGDATTVSGYTVHFEVTGTGGGSWNWLSVPNDPNHWTGVGTDQAVGPLSSGSHTFKLWVDYYNDVGESNESNNYYERTITVSGVGAADLTPYQPSHWNDKIPIGTSQLAGNVNHSDTGPYYANQTLYFNWGSLNQGSTTASGYTVHFEVTGTGGGTWNWTNVATDPNYWTHLLTDQAVGPLSAGSHTFKVWVDYSNTVTESNESNNYYERTITVSAVGAADLRPYQPSHWNDKIPIGTSQLAGDASHSDTGPYYSNQTLYFNWGSLNQGSGAASGYTVHFEVTGTGGGTWNWPNVTTDPNYWTFLLTDQAVGPLSVGNHTFKLWLDYNNGVSESDEANNYYERTIAVGVQSQVTYYAECADSPDFSSPTSSGWIAQRSTTFQNLAPGRTYWYRVKAKSGATESDWSNIEHSQQEAPLTDFTIGGYLGVGTETPQRAVHLVGPNAVFRMDRSADTAAFLLVRTDALGNPLKAFVVGANASGPNQGEFIINDIGAAVGGGGQRRLTITNTGDTIFGGSLTGTSFFPSSSLGLKTNVRALENPLAKVRGLAGVQFDWKSTERPSLGVIAEDVARVLPEVVSREPQTGFLQGVSYDSLVGLLLESSKAQGRQIDALRAKRDQLRRLLEELMKSNRRLEERDKP